MKRPLSAAVDKLKQTKTDTFWPATGELWCLIREYRKACEIAAKRLAQGALPMEFPA